jgi:hypothetical protein
MPHITTLDKAIPYHPFTKEFPPLDNAAFEALVADIKIHGQREPITLYDGRVLDGVHRYRACLRLKIKPRFEEFEGDDAAALAFTASKNLHRRHLTPKQRRERLAKFVAMQPGKSDRALACEAGVDHHQIARARKKAEAAGTKVPEKRVGLDSKARKPPSRKPRPTHKAPTDKPAEAVMPKPLSPPPHPDDPPASRIFTHDEPTLLREFALFVIGRTRVTTDPKDHAEFKALLGKVKAELGIS